jgi:hypothetical protein
MPQGATQAPAPSRHATAAEVIEDPPHQAGAPGVSADPALSWRAIAVAVLCAVTTVGLLARQALPAAGNSWAARASAEALYDLTGVADGAAALGAVIVLAVVFRMRRDRRNADKESPGTPLPWWTRLLSMLLPLVVVAIPVALLIRELLYRRAHAAPALASRGIVGIFAGHGRGSSSGSWAIVAGMALTVVAVIVYVVFEARRRAGLERLTALALRADAAAIGQAADPRAGIIACYAAMERSLADAGAVPAATDTPDEVLARAASGGLVRSAAASELTGLFRQARYGGRSIAEPERTAAQGALARLTADLDGQQ